MNNNFNEKQYSQKMPLKDNDKIRIDFILSNIKDDNCEILDLGCWDGSYAKLYFKKTNKVYGIESSATSAEKAKEKGIIVEQGFFPDDNLFINKKFDYIVAGEIIEHVFDTDAFLEAINKRLKEGGTLIITTPNVASLPRRFLLLLGINPMLDFRSRGEVAGHIRYFTFKDLKNLLEKNNFKIISEKSDVLSFDNKGIFYSKLIPKLHKEFGRTIMMSAKKL
jgi:2-polyprenyl-3-methyl-5-hydroxy-6-metoxy-1,4-benzoquinol methylase